MLRLKNTQTSGVCSTPIAWQYFALMYSDVRAGVGQWCYTEVRTESGSWCFMWIFNQHAVAMWYPPQNPVTACTVRLNCVCSSAPLTNLTFLSFVSCPSSMLPPNHTGSIWLRREARSPGESLVFLCPLRDWVLVLPRGSASQARSLHTGRKAKCCRNFPCWGRGGFKQTRRAICVRQRM